MKKSAVVLISVLLALGCFALVLSQTISFSSEPVEYSPGLLVDLLETPEAETPAPDSQEAPDTPASSAVTEAPVQSSAVPTEVPSEVPATPSPSFTPVPLTMPDLPVEASSVMNPEDYSGLPVITITDATYPDEVITTNSVIDLLGNVRTDSGQLTEIYAEIAQDGKMKQNCQFEPMATYFSLAGTVNAKLHFSSLAPGDYTYRVTASATNDVGSACETLIDASFTVVEQGSSLTAGTGSSAAPAYVARTVEDTDNASHIWNFLIGQFGNPYAAAGILANMEAESNLSPTASQGEYLACGYGLCQWTYERRERLGTFAELAGTDMGDIDLQLCYVIYELDNYYPQLKQLLLDATDGYTAASKFCAIYEQAASYGQRSSYVQGYLDRFASP